MTKNSKEKRFELGQIRPDIKSKTVIFNIDYVIKIRPC